MGRFYNNSSVQQTLYNSGRTEISMRDELLNTFNGTFSEISKKQKGLIRVLRRDSNSIPIKCACTSSAWNSPDKDGFCPYCHGVGYIWDEDYVWFYRWEPGSDTTQALADKLVLPGKLNVPLRLFYLDYSNNLTKDDLLIELELGKNGTPSIPLRRRFIYRLGYLYDYRLDNGRLEYWQAIGYEDKTLPLNIGL